MTLFGNAMNIRQTVGNLRDRLNRMLRSPSEELGRGGRFVAYQIRLWLFCGRKLVKDRLQVTASALSYKTLLSLIPVLVLFTLILTIIPEGEIRQGIRDRVFEAAGLRSLNTGASPDEAEPLDADPAAVPSGTVEENREQTGSVADALTGMVERVVSDVRGGGGAITVISVVMFVWAGMSIFKTVEGAFNYIWEVRRGRSLFARFRDFLTSIILFVLLVGVAIWWTQKYNVGALIAGVSGVIPLVIAWVLFFVVYKTVPTVRVQTRAALMAAVVAGTLWELGAKTGFVLYLKHATGVRQLYGNLAAIPVFMIWIWLSWIIVLFGAELAYVIQYMKDLTRDLFESESHRRFVRADLAALAAATVVARRFASGGEPPTRRELSEAVGISEGDIGEVLQALQDAGLVRQADRQDGQRGYQPGKPLDQITAASVIAAAASVELIPSGTAGRGRMMQWARSYISEVSRDAAETLSGETLNALARRAEQEQ